jgi:ubiquitin-conjugating enzyme E2 variant
MTARRVAPHAGDNSGTLTWAVELTCLVGAAALFLVDVFRLWTTVGLRWWVPIVVVAAGVVADLGSGVVHWTADTWGSDTMPVIGRRFLLPFRVHHLDPQDFLRRGFVDCNGDVAMLTLPVLIGATLLPATTTWGGVVAVALVALAGWALPTNQVHQWAHMPDPPRAVRWLQRRGILLSVEAHQRHHVSPYAVNYCIATGWCNGVATISGLFVGLERVITHFTGVMPREDERELDRRVAES